MPIANRLRHRWDRRRAAYHARHKTSELIARGNVAQCLVVRGLHNDQVHSSAAEVDRLTEIKRRRRVAQLHDDTEPHTMTTHDTAQYCSDAAACHSQQHPYTE